MTASSHQRVLIVGCGYVGRRLARRLLPQHDVSAWVQSEASVRTLANLGVSAHAMDLDRSDSTAAALAGVTDETLVYYLTPPPNEGESDTRLNRFFNFLKARLSAFIYLSTTGVYGDAGGALVDESTRVAPITERAQRRVSAEEISRVWCNEAQVRRVVLRVPGIYGPHRLPLDVLRRGDPVVRQAEAGISNRIHVDDLVEALLQAAARADARGVYNVTDGSSTTQTEFLLTLARLAQLPPPREVSMEEAQLTFSPVRLSFINESRRLSNRRMLQELQVRLRYPDMVEGIRQSLAEEQMSATSS